MQQEQKFSRYFKFGLLVIFVLALGVRLAYLNVAASGRLGDDDSPAYEALAEALKTGRYTSDAANAKPGTPGGFPADLQRPPGYPVLLVLQNPVSGVSRFQTALVQSALGALFAAFLALAVGRLINAPVGLLSGLFYAFDWITIVHTPRVQADMMFAVFLTAAVLAYGFYLYRRRLGWTLVAGLLMGAAALIKPAAQVAVIAFIVASLFQPTRRWVGLLFLAGYVACVAPWMARNLQTHGLFTMSEAGTVVLRFYTAQAAQDDRYEQNEVMTLKVEEMRTEWDQKSLSPPERKRLMREEAASLLENKGTWPRVLKAAAKGLARTAIGPGRESTSAAIGGVEEGAGATLRYTVLPLVQVLLLWAFAAIGAFVGVWKKLLPLPAAILFLGVLLFIWATNASPVGYSRYRVHFVPLLCLWAALGVSYVSGMTRTYLNLRRNG